MRVPVRKDFMNGCTPKKLILILASILLSICIGCGVSKEAAGSAIAVGHSVVETDMVTELNQWFIENAGGITGGIALPDELMIQYALKDAMGYGAAEDVAWIDLRLDSYGSTLRDVINCRAHVEAMEAKVAVLMLEAEYLMLNQNFAPGNLLTELGYHQAGVVDRYAVYRAENAFFEKAKDESTYKLAKEAIGLKEDCIEIDLPGVSEEYELLFVSDMHITTLDDTVSEESLAVARERYYHMFRTAGNIASADNWMILSSILDRYEADGIVFGGDMMDFVSPTNVDLLKKGLDQIDTPYMYLRADHDFGTWYSGGRLDHGAALKLHSNISEYEDVYILEYEDFYIFGWNNSTSEMTADGLKAAEDIWDNGKPIILATHVPLNSMVDEGLKETSASIDPQGRSKIWGLGCLYYPDETTISFLNMVYEEESPVKAVLSGHLHFKYTVPLTENIMGYVFAPAFAGNIARIRIY